MEHHQEPGNWSPMAESKKRSRSEEVTFITWNINKRPELVSELQMYDEPDVLFLQETGVSVAGEMSLEGWRVFYTKFSSSSKGAAILVRDVDFLLYNAEVDPNGCYVIVQCRLRGSDYTLVSVYHHKHDVGTLDLLTPYLQHMSRGTLVIGGDFNTTFSKVDRARLEPDSELKNYERDNPHHQSIRKPVERLMRNLQLVDVLKRINRNTDSGKTMYTFKTQGRNHQTKELETRWSRLDYFFIPEERMSLVKDCEVITAVNENDHRPLLLKLDMVSDDQCTKPPTLTQLPLSTNQFIGGVEIVAAILSLQLSEEPRCDGIPVSKYKPLSEKTINELKIKYNQFLDECSLPPGFSSTRFKNGYHIFNVDYLILAQVLSWRLKDWRGTKEKRTNQIRSPEQRQHHLPKIQCSDLQEYIRKKLEDHPAGGTFSILQHMLSDGGDGQKQLLDGCPLTPTIYRLMEHYGERQFGLPADPDLTDDSNDC